MKSKWFKLKGEAIKIRKDGMSIGYVEKKLGIPRSTLSGWFKNIQLTRQQKNQLYQNWKNALVKARKKAVIWHNQQKEIRIKEAERQALHTLSKIDINDKVALELALAFLYLGEGFKTNTGTGIGSSDPMILKFFITALVKNYRFDRDKIKCELHLRADQKPNKLRKYWSKELNLSLTNFTTISIDRRTAGSRTYPTYKGVCALRCGSVAIQRKLIYLSKAFCQRVINIQGS
jgi:hypothetical protein